jgi:hypothetical protein
LWLQLIPELQGLGAGRGAGLRTEPSLLAAPFALFLSLLVLQLRGAAPQQRTKLLAEAAFTIGALVILTRSLSLLIAVMCFGPALVSKIRYILTVGLAVIGLAFAVFADRLMQGFSEASGSLIYLITFAVGSWRNVPDLLILSNAGEYLVPGNPAQVREHLNALAAAWLPGFEWLENTFSTFAAAATSLGLIVTTCVFVGGMLFGLRYFRTERSVRSTWILLYIASWFFFAKYEATGWLALAVLFAIPSPAMQTKNVLKVSWYKKLARAACTPKIRSVSETGLEPQH